MSKRSRKKIPTEIITATVNHLNHEGRGVTHINGKTTFIFDALPNETVEFKYTHCHSKYDEGTTTNVIEKSPDRVTPRCQYFGICGGCSLQHLAPDMQRTHKEAVLLEHFKHQANCTPLEILPPLFSNAFNYGYRRRARLSVRYVTKKNAVLIGFRERNAGFDTDMLQCETLHPSVGYKINALRDLLMQLKIKSEIPQLEVAIGDTISAVIIRHMVELPESDREKLITFAK